MHSHLLGVLPFTVPSILAALSYSEASRLNKARRQSQTTYEGACVLDYMDGGQTFTSSERKRKTKGGDEGRKKMESKREGADKRAG